MSTHSDAHSDVHSDAGSDSGEYPCGAFVQESYLRKCVNGDISRVTQADRAQLRKLQANDMTNNYDNVSGALEKIKVVFFCGNVVADEGGMCLECADNRCDIRGQPGPINVKYVADRTRKDTVDKTALKPRPTRQLRHTGRRHQEPTLSMNHGASAPSRTTSEEVLYVDVAKVPQSKDANSADTSTAANAASTGTAANADNHDSMIAAVVKQHPHVFEDGLRKLEKSLTEGITTCAISIATDPSAVEKLTCIGSQLKDLRIAMGYLSVASQSADANPDVSSSPVANELNRADMSSEEEDTPASKLEESVIGPNDSARDTTKSV